MSDTPAAPSSAPAGAAAPAAGSNKPTSDATAQAVNPAEKKPSTGARSADGQFTSATTGTPKPPVESAPSKRTLKFKGPGGQDVEIDEERAIAELSMGMGYKKKFSEFDQQRKQFEAALAKAKENPDELLKHIGMDPDEWAQQRAWQRLSRELEDSRLTPEEKQARAQRMQFEQERAQFERQRKEFEQAQQEAEIRQEQERIAPLLKQHIPESLAKVGLPHSGMALERVQSYLRDAIETNEPITPALIEFAAQSAREEIGEAAKGLVAEMTAPQLLQFFGEDVANKIRLHDLEQYEKAHAVQRPAEQAAPTPKPAAPTYLTEAQVARFNRTGRYD